MQVNKIPTIRISMEKLRLKKIDKNWKETLDFPKSFRGIYYEREWLYLTNDWWRKEREKKIKREIQEDNSR